MIEASLTRFREGDGAAKNDLLNHAYSRLYRLTQAMMGGYFRLHGVEEDADILQNSLIRLTRALDEIKPKTTREFYGLAALQIRRQLIDLSRYHFGPKGIARRASPMNHDSDAGGESRISTSPQNREPQPDSRIREYEVHQMLAQLPDDLLEVVDLIYYNGLTQEEAAGILSLSVRTIKRRWREARLRLVDLLSQNFD